MKTLNAVLLLLSITTPCLADRIEVPIQNVLIPRQGFDDNDHVGAVVYGELPHACMTLGETLLENTTDGEWRVRQAAWTKTTGVCSGGDVPDSPVPFTVEVSFGRLNAGTYRIKYSDGGEVRTRAFKVGVAETEVIDDYNYAEVNDVLAPNLAITTENIVVTLRGLVDVSCAGIGNRLKIERQGDVFVVLPIETRRVGSACRRDLKQYSRTVELGSLPSGQYLVHVRSKNGKAVNKVFNVYGTSLK